MGVFRKFPRTFWVANTIELFERWAWYGFFMLLPLPHGIIRHGWSGIHAKSKRNPDGCGNGNSLLPACLDRGHS